MGGTLRYIPSLDAIYFALGVPFRLEVVGVSCAEDVDDRNEARSYDGYVIDRSDAIPR